MKIYWHDAGHMAKMAATPIYGNQVVSEKSYFTYLWMVTYET